MAKEKRAVFKKKVLHKIHGSFSNLSKAFRKRDKVKDAVVVKRNVRGSTRYVVISQVK